MKKFLKIIGIILAIFVAYCAIAMLFLTANAITSSRLSSTRQKRKFGRM